MNTDVYLCCDCGCWIQDVSVTVHETGEVYCMDCFNGCAGEA